MKLNSLMSRRVGLGLLGVLLLGALAFVVMRSGPLAPIRVTVIEVTEGRLTPALFASARSRHVGPT